MEKHADNSEFDDFSVFVDKLNELIGNIDGITNNRLQSIAMEMSEMDKTAVVQRDKKGNILFDQTTKDTELVGLKIDTDDYFTREVYPHVPDAIYIDECDLNKKASFTKKEKMGAEFSFTRYFYEYKASDKADDLLDQFLKIEHKLADRITALTGSKR